LFGLNILENPPKKQVVASDGLGWRESPPTGLPEAEKILLYVRRVRNNLFHGGKFNGKWFAPERSGELIKHCLIILDACRDAEKDVKEAYNH
jgi:hypothetical protein